jgi:hypothetical protein
MTGQRGRSHKFSAVSETVAIFGAAMFVAAVAFAAAAQAWDILDMPAQGVPPYPPPPAGSVAPYVQAPPAVQAPAAPAPAASPWSFGFPWHFRLEGGAGYNNSGTDTTVSSPGIGSVSTNLFGGGGLAAEAAFWSDAMLYPTISLGAQYLHFDHSGSITATSAAGPVLGLTSATGHLDLTTNAVMFDAAWRPSVQGFHPFVGAGVGVAFSELSGSGLGFSASNSQTALAGQAFFGFDYDVAPGIYAGLTGRFFIGDATYHVTSVNLPNGSNIPVLIRNNIDITNRPISLMGHIGVQF